MEEFTYTLKNNKLVLTTEFTFDVIFQTTPLLSKVTYLIIKCKNNSVITTGVSEKYSYIVMFSLVPIFFIIFILLTGCLWKKHDPSGDNPGKKIISVNKGKKSGLSGKKFSPPPPAVEKPFPSVGSVSLDTLIKEMEKQVKIIAQSKNMKKEFHEFADRHNLKETSDLYNDYVRVKLLFEATRDAGLWNIKWDITNEEPRSDKIWAQWKKWKGDKLACKSTATAECDEISALFAFLARKMGVKETGLFWPTSNHTIAVWKLKSKNGKNVRIIVPTTQIFLAYKDRFDTRSFDPWKQEAIYDYGREDVKGSYTIPADLARFFIIQVEKYGAASEETLHHLRYLREEMIDGSVPRESMRSNLMEMKSRLMENGKPMVDIWAIDYFMSDVGI